MKTFVLCSCVIILLSLTSATDVTSQAPKEQKKNSANENSPSGYVIGSQSGFPWSYKRKRVAFSVYRRSYYRVYPDYATVIPFDAVVVNYGAGWNDTSYHFVAPVSGIYVFYVSLRTFFSGHRYCVKASIMHNNVPQASLLENIEDGMGTNQIIKFINKDDHVWVQMEMTSYYYLEYNQPHTYNMFSGFLLTKGST